MPLGGRIEAERFNQPQNNIVSSKPADAAMLPTDLKATEIPQNKPNFPVAPQRMRRQKVRLNFPTPVPVEVKARLAPGRTDPCRADSIPVFFASDYGTGLY